MEVSHCQNRKKLKYEIVEFSFSLDSHGTYVCYLQDYKSSANGSTYRFCVVLIYCTRIKYPLVTKS